MHTPALSGETMTAVVSQALGRPVTIAKWQLDTVDYVSGSPATGGLYRLHGLTSDGTAWQVFLKLLQHVRHWDRLHLLPPHLRDSFAADFPWRTELIIWDEDFPLPDDLKRPQLYKIEDLGDDRLLVWMEYVVTDPGPWSLELFAQAAHALGGLAALRSTSDAVAASKMPPGFGLRMYVNGRVAHGGVPMLHNDDLWQHPFLATADPHLRSDLIRLAEHAPQILDRLDALPQSIPHGDASPQNMLLRNGQFVAIDMAFQCPCAIGFDLGQLLIGLVHAGELPAADLPKVHERLVPAFTEGLGKFTTGQVRYGYAGSLVLRAGFTSIPFDQLDQPATPERIAMFTERIALTRFIANLALPLLEA